MHSNKGIEICTHFEYPWVMRRLDHLSAGATDGQSPHREDEVYYILKGRATLVVDGDEHPVKAGTTVYVRRAVEHRFHEIEEDLTVLVFFATPPAA